MRQVTREYQIESVAAGDETQEKISSGFLTRASLAVAVSGASALVGSVILQGSNSTTGSGQRLAANMEPYFEPAEWVVIATLPVDTATGTGSYGAAYSIAHRFIRVVLSVDSGTADNVTIGLHAMNEAA